MPTTFPPGLLWLLVAIATLFAPLPAAAQMRVLVNDVGLIDDVDDGLNDDEIDVRPTRQVIKAIERELDQFVRAKLALVRLVCAPTDEQLAVLQRSGERQVAEEIAAVRNGLEHGIQPWVQFADDATARERRLEQLIEDALDAARRAKYNDERHAEQERRRQAQIANWLAAFDQVLWLSDPQRDELIRLLDERWRQPGEQPPYWVAISDGRVVLFRRIHGAVVRGTTGLPRLADAEWAVLRETQRTAWRESQQSPQAARKRVEARQRLEQRQQVENWKLFAPYLEWSIDHADTIVGLSATQRRKLELAGKVDFQRFIDQRKARRAEKNAPPDAVLAIAAPIAIDRPQGLEVVSTVIAGESSLFRKLLKHVLTGEQFGKLNDSDARRRRFADDAARQGTVAAIAERVPLTASQWAELSNLLGQEVGLAVEPSPFDCWAIAAQVPRSRLKPLFDESQWELFERMLDTSQGRLP